MINILYEKDHCHIRYNNQWGDIEERVSTIFKFFCLALDEHDDLVYYRSPADSLFEKQELIHQFVEKLNEYYGDIIVEESYN